MIARLRCRHTIALEQYRNICKWLSVTSTRIDAAGHVTAAPSVSNSNGETSKRVGDGWLKPGLQLFPFPNQRVS